jgi:hypothetical protein
MNSLENTYKTNDIRFKYIITKHPSTTISLTLMTTVWLTVRLSAVEACKKNNYEKFI